MKLDGREYDRNQALAGNLIDDKEEQDILEQLQLPSASEVHSKTESTTSFWVPLGSSSKNSFIN